MKIHDFREGRWANSITMTHELPEDKETGMPRKKWTGHGKGIEAGDFILRSLECGRVGKYRVDKAEYWGNVPDMFTIEVTAIGFAGEEDIQQAVIEKRPSCELNPKFEM